MIIDGDMLSYTPAIGRTRSFHYSDIKQITLDITTSVKLISHEGKRLAVFELNMPGSIPALSYLESLGIPSKKSRLAQRLSEKKSACMKEEKDYILSHCDEETILREKKVCRIYIAFFVIYDLILTNCYLLTLLIRKRKEHIGKFLSMLFAVMFLALLSLPVINVVTTFEQGSYETVRVSGLEIHSRIEYHLVVEVQDISKTFVVSRELYSSVAENDFITLCRRQSIFGVEWIVLQQ